MNTTTMPKPKNYVNRNLPSLTVTITPMQILWIKKQSKRAGISLSEYLRRILDAEMNKNP